MMMLTNRIPPASVAVALFALAIVLFFWIPGVGIILALIAAGLAIATQFASGMRSSVIFGVTIALLGIAAIPFVDPILGTVVLIAGGTIAVAAPLVERLIDRR